MNFLFDNPIANLPGISFLILYGILTVFSAIVFYFFKSKMDWTQNQPIPLINSTPDPFEIAYLRGGLNELIRTLIFSLNQKGFLNISNEGKKSYIVLSLNQPNWTTLSNLERATLPWFQATRETSEIFASNGLTDLLKPFALAYEQKLSQNNLLTPSDVVSKTRILSYLFLLGLLAVGSYKIVAALMHGRINIIFLVVLMIITSILFIRLGKSKRVSELGQKYLSGLQNTFEKLKRPGNSAPVFNSFDPTLLAVGVFGTSVLLGSQYGDFEQAFHRSNSSGGSDCGAACGSSCGSGGDGGSSCSGGGCGGCGGCS